MNEARLPGDDIRGSIRAGKIEHGFGKIQPGDLVLTSGLGGNYPSNLLIGQVTGIRSQAVNLFQTASVQPVVDFTQLEIVLVITNFRAIDTTPLIPTPAP